jgi:hypothetical protein
MLQSPAQPQSSTPRKSRGVDVQTPVSQFIESKVAAGPKTCAKEQVMAWFRAVWACVLLAAPALAWAAGPLATVTILDGNAIAIREANRLVLAEGVQLQKDDIVDTGAEGRLLRLEFSDGLVLDLGPATRVLLAPRLSGDRGKQLRFYLLSGWAKVGVPKDKTAATAAFASPAIDVSGITRHLVVSSQPGELLAFAEAGEVTLVDRRSAPVPLTLKSDDFLTLAGTTRPQTAARPSAAFMQKVPRPFLDTIPPRVERFKAEVSPRNTGVLSYEEAQPWIDAEPGVRSLFLARWKSLAQNPTFRVGLITGLKAHPEWDRVLYPEKYMPKPPAEAASKAWYRP